MACLFIFECDRNRLAGGRWIEVRVASRPKPPRRLAALTLPLSDASRGTTIYHKHILYPLSLVETQELLPRLPYVS